MIRPAIAGLGGRGRNLVTAVRNCSGVLFHPMHICRLAPSADPGRSSPVTPRAIETQGFKVRIANKETGG